MTKQAGIQAGGLMAILHPPLEALSQLVSPLNGGELRVARALAEQLDDSWTIYIQPRLELDVPDFVAVHDLHGVCAIEVKDWSYGKYRVAATGAIQYRSGHGWAESGQNPRYQAYRYRSTVFEQFFALPGDSGCVLPAVRESCCCSTIRLHTHVDCSIIRWFLRHSWRSRCSVMMRWPRSRTSSSALHRRLRQQSHWNDSGAISRSRA